MHTTTDPSSDPALLDTLAQMPAQLQALARALPPHRHAWRPGSDLFSLLEHACHLRDLEAEGYQLRIRRLVEEDLPELQEIDGSSWAVERDYQAQSLDEAMGAFAAHRARTVALLADTLPRHAGRKGLFGGFGIVTLGELVRGMAAHDASHREEIAALVAAAAQVA
ncbi:DinB family protein [Ideonella sp. BN130291]|uniref:DinB family protein n=1 Tax=Ideonella sp. BN130291 TaxID=3112940 RepID=UPI002E26F512|nr:DinB family protein [Ideonella sp. BN130291]